MFDITGFQLKIAAIVAMTCNHVANVFGPMLPAPFDFALYAVGGVTYPIMAFLVVEGYIHTSNLGKYAWRLALFALVAQVPYYLVFGEHLNVLFTLLIGLGILWVCERANPAVGLLVTIACTAVLHGVMDWGTTGLVIVYLFGTLREARRKGTPAPVRAAHPEPRTPEEAAAQEELAQADLQAPGGLTKAERRLNLITIIGTMLVPMGVTISNGIRWGSAFTLGYALVGYTIATVLLCGYRGRRGRPMKWFFYAYYPLHLFAIWGVKAFLV